MVIENTLVFIQKIAQNPETPGFVKKLITHFLNQRKTAGLKLFMVISSLMGAAFISAGIFAIISHNWDDFHKHVKGGLSLIPALAGLYFYFIAVFKHSESLIWKETSGLFLFFMIGASIALVSQTYHMDGDFNKFVKVWLLLSIPILYITKSSSIVPFYLGLALNLAQPDIIWSWFFPSGIRVNEQLIYFWLFFLALIPHYYFALNKTHKQQGIRVVFLTWVMALVLFVWAPFIFPGGTLFWLIGLIIFGYEFNRRFFNNNSFLQRPLDVFIYYLLGLVLVILAAAPEFSGGTYIYIKSIRWSQIGEYDAIKMIFFILGVLIFLASFAWSVLKFSREKEFNKHLSVVPFIVAIQLLFYYVATELNFDMLWIGDWLVYLFIIGFSIHCLADGSKKSNFSKIIYGFILISLFLWLRYTNSDMNFILKGFTFMLVGGFFFVLTYIADGELENIEDEE